MLAKVLNAPVSELPVRNEVDIRYNFLNSRALEPLSETCLNNASNLHVPFRLQHNSRRCSVPPSSLFLPKQLHATSLEELR